VKALRTYRSDEASSVSGYALAVKRIWISIVIIPYIVITHLLRGLTYGSKFIRPGVPGGEDVSGVQIPDLSSGHGSAGCVFNVIGIGIGRYGIEV